MPREIMPREIILAEHAGFCFGVRRAIEAVEQLPQQQVYILGQLVHNPQVVEKLKERGAQVIEREQLHIPKPGDTVVITAHGVPDSLKEEARQRGFNVIDTTCPLVTLVHDKGRDLEQQGYKVLLYGNKQHVEVKGTVGNLKDVTVVSDFVDLSELEGYDKVALISQTTMAVADYEEMQEKIKEKFSGVKIVDTICNPTKVRQSSARELAPHVDIMVVIGGKNSSNTRHLNEVCSRYTQSIHIEKPEELSPELFEGKKKIGVTAGASTPDWVIQEVIDRIKGFDDNKY